MGRVFVGLHSLLFSLSLSHILILSVNGGGKSLDTGVGWGVMYKG